jgi:hypothetical protein
MYTEVKSNEKQNINDDVALILMPCRVWGRV